MNKVTNIDGSDYETPSELTVERLIDNLFGNPIEQIVLLTAVNGSVDILRQQVDHKVNKND